MFQEHNRFLCNWILGSRWSCSMSQVFSINRIRLLSPSIAGFGVRQASLPYGCLLSKNIGLIYFAMWIFVCVSPKVLCWNCNPQCDDVKRYTFEEYLVHESGVLKNAVSALIKTELESCFFTLCSAPCKNTRI